MCMRDCVFIQLGDRLHDANFVEETVVRELAHHKQD